MRKKLLIKTVLYTLFAGIPTLSYGTVLVLDTPKVLQNTGSSSYQDYLMVERMVYTTTIPRLKSDTETTQSTDSGTISQQHVSYNSSPAPRVKSAPSPRSKPSSGQRKRGGQKRR